MDASSMVKKTALLVIGIIAVLLVVAALRVTRRCGDNDRIIPGKSSAVGTALLSQKEPLTEGEVQKCFLAFEEIGNAYSNLQFDTMQEVFCSISNNVARLGKDRLDKAIEVLQTSFREQFWMPDVKARQFSSVSEFERFIRVNVAAENIIGYSMLANGLFDGRIRMLAYDMAVFRSICDFAEEFKERNDDAFAMAALSLLDDWKEHLASGQSVTRMYLRQELKFFLRLPRWQAEDLGMKSERDWIVYMRNRALKYHEQCYGVVPTWIDEDFPLLQKGDADLGGHME